MILKQEKFYSSLTNAKISDQGDEHILKFWNTFEVKVMKDYYNFYVKCDILF